MNWQSAPIGMIRHDELLNALLAIWKTQHSITCRHELTVYSSDYQAGFEEALEAIAQVAGLSEAFEAAKCSHLAKMQARECPKIEVVESQARLVDAF